MQVSKSRTRRPSKAAAAKAAAALRHRQLVEQLRRSRRLRDSDRAQASLGGSRLLSAADRQALDASIASLELQLQGPT